MNKFIKIAFVFLFMLQMHVFAQPGLVYESEENSTTQLYSLAHQGMERWKKEKKSSYFAVKVEKSEEVEAAIRQLIAQGANPVIASGAHFGDVVDQLSEEFPKVNFVNLDEEVAGSNVASFVFKEEEGGFLMGYLAALSSKTGFVGFVGAMDVPLVRKLQCSFTQGAKVANPDVMVFNDMVGASNDAWNLPAKAYRLAKAQFAQGVDVIFAVAGESGIGVYKAANDNKKHAISMNKVSANPLYSDALLSAMTKRLDNAAYLAASDFKPGLQSMGLKDNGMDYSIETGGKKLINKLLKERLESMRNTISSGKMRVIDYTLKNVCR
jgi:basic membrane protein A